MKRKFILMEMTVAVVLGCALITWIFDGSLKWLANLPARIAIERPVERYSVTPLNWGVSGRVHDLSESGLAAGVGCDGEGRTYAALWKDGQTTKCYDLNDDYGSEAISISDDGAIAFKIGTHRQDVAFSYVQMPDGEKVCLNELLPGIRQCSINGMNADCTAVGMAEKNDGVWMAWVWSPDAGMRTLSEQGEVANAINAGGTIAGMDRTTTASGTPQIWTRAEDGSYTAVAPQGRTYEGRSYAINSEGVVVGRVIGPKPMRWDEEAGMTILPGLNDTGAGWAHDVNDHGDIVGCLTGADGGLAILWRDGKAYDLNKCIPQNLGLHLVEATAINNEGVIACRAISEQDGATPLLLMPMEEEWEQQVAWR